MAALRPLDSPALRKARGAFFTPPLIADFLASWAVGSDQAATVLDPTCGEAVFLLAAAEQLRALGVPAERVREQIYGVDLHQQSLDEARRLLASEGLDATFLTDDFFALSTPDRLDCRLPAVDAVIGNPPFVRYQQHIGDTRRRSTQAALAQGVRLSGLASSWAALLVHSAGFLKPEGRLAMVLPAELLTVHYAEPVRRWLRQRFAAVHLVMFERLQFSDAMEKVVLVIAQGSGGCDAFSLYHVSDADGLAQIRPFDHFNVTPADEGKWTDLLLPIKHRQVFKRVTTEHFAGLASFGVPELGTVTGANGYFAINEKTASAFGLGVAQLTPISPPGTKHLRGTSFSTRDWETLRRAGEAVWLLHPEPDDKSPALRRYLAHGERQGVHEAYKCQVRTPWWRPPMVSPPDLFFTYMSHRYPRLIANTANVTFVNSMHGVRLRADAPEVAKQALPLLCMNSVTMLGAEVHGRSYGGGVLKMEPREAGALPVPGARELEAAWAKLRPDRAALERRLREGDWQAICARVDDVLLREVCRLPADDIAELQTAALSLRERRIGRAPAAVRSEV